MLRLAASYASVVFQLLVVGDVVGGYRHPSLFTEMADSVGGAKPLAKVQVRSVNKSHLLFSLKIREQMSLSAATSIRPPLLSSESLRKREMN